MHHQHGDVSTNPLKSLEVPLVVIFKIRVLGDVEKINCLNLLVSIKIHWLDKAYIIMKKIPHDVIKKGEKSNQRSYYDF